MNKKQWLEAALKKIDSMSRDEFVSALHRSCMVTVSETDSSVVDRLSSCDFDGFFRIELVGNHKESFPFENQWLSLNTKVSSTAPQEAQYHCLAA
ncbi:TPA: hypothetical protein ACXIJW_002337 [Serratia marcescens]|jgi:hypothetical protein